MQLKQGRESLPLIKTDPLGRCAAVLLNGLQIIIIKAAEAGDDGGGFVSALINFPDLDIKHVKDFIFVHGYNEPVLVILHEKQLTRPPYKKHHACVISALSISTTSKQHPLIWFTTNLPHDAYKLFAVPSSVGGVLVVCADTIHYHGQSASCILALNNYAVPLDSSQEVSWLSNDVAMLSTKSPELLMLTLVHDGRIVHKLDISKSKDSVLTPEITTVGSSFFFLRSPLGDSLLVQLRCGVGSSMGPKEERVRRIGGEGGPYAPVNFPEVGDIWGWSIGSRINQMKSTYKDRFLALPERYRSRYESIKGYVPPSGFRSRASVTDFIKEEFGKDIVKSFFDSFVWDIPAPLEKKHAKKIEKADMASKLHVQHQEPKDNTRVFCRVRPVLSDHDGPTKAKAATVTYPSSVESEGQVIGIYKSGKKYSFIFDKVFDHHTTQQDVFLEIYELVQSAVDGYKVCIFAYGPSGSGKTYTMMGSPLQKGLIPRSVEQVFQTTQALADQGWIYRMQVSVFEVFNETVRDLLSLRSSNGAEGATAAGKQYTTRHDDDDDDAADGNTDLTIVNVCSVPEVSKLFQQAARSRYVGITDMNRHSSRSNLVFTMRIHGVNESTGQQVQGVLNLIDLACTGERLKATDKSLSSLTDVIFALPQKEKEHVSFTNSKLTDVLEPFLGGDSKALMIVNISPDPSSIRESLRSLLLLARANLC